MRTIRRLRAWMTWAEHWTPNKRFISAISSAVSPVRLIQSGVATTPVSADCIRKLCRSIARRFVHSLTSSRGVLPEWSFASKRSMQACQNLASRHFCSRAARRINFSQIANTAALRLFNIRRTVQREMRSLRAISVTDWPAKNLITTWKRCLWRFIVRFLRVAQTEGAVSLSESSLLLVRRAEPVRCNNSQAGLKPFDASGGSWVIVGRFQLIGVSSGCGKESLDGYSIPRN